MFCSQCGTEAITEGRFCQQCGCQLSDTDIQQLITLPQRVNLIESPEQKTSEQFKEGNQGKIENDKKGISALQVVIYAIIFLGVLIKYNAEPKDVNCDGNCVNGHGTYTWPDGRRYTGNWKNDHIEGDGTFYYINGNEYSGDWINGKFEGKGTLIIKNVGKYVGDFHDGVFEGQGTYFWVDGNQYVGEFRSGVRDGQGTMTSKTYKYAGEWKSDRFEGQGTYLWANGQKYTGEWKNDHFEGQGTLFKADGTKYIGEFSNDEPVNGKGNSYNADGSLVDNSEINWDKIIDGSLTVLKAYSAYKESENKEH